MQSLTSYNSENQEDVINLASNSPKKRAGRRKFHETRHPVFRGVRRRNDSWVCEVRDPNKKNSRIWLGTYPFLEMAARAHDVAAMALRGRLACLNYADSAWRLPVPASTNREDIQRAAAEAAEAFRPKEEAAVATVEPPENVFSMVDDNIETFMDDDEASYGMHGLMGSMAEVWMTIKLSYGMHGLMGSMAEGLMLPLPQYRDDLGGVGAGMSLWSF
ncbi:hypothetical protein BUALT_Bualt06G0116200 [Buddleja alternifolia]|uniref:AP2/ERF domain-containing protein n=1 Tax=Buddleja alternifolia TaxID=168488 RepID=A0AAV6XIR4_9LAMI|nr:hypothetical protein BUALT_Bualt06G0116200 [Buddleja alternifolia]